MSYYPSSCDSFIAHDPDPCEEREFGRIRSAGFIRTDYSFDSTSPAAWLTGITNGQIIVIPETNGEAGKGSPVIGPKYGPYAGAVLGYEFTATYEDPNYNSNCAFYNQLVGNLNYTFFYRTSSQVYLTAAPATIIPNRVVKNSLDDEVTWEVEVRWISKAFPCGAAIPDGVFDQAPYYYYMATITGGGSDPWKNIGVYTGDYTFVVVPALEVDPKFSGTISDDTFHLPSTFSMPSSG
jgi:hypothetical protein